MAKFISGLLPKLATDVAHDEIPVSEINGDAARGASSGSGGTQRATARKTRSSKSTTRRTTKRTQKEARKAQLREKV